VGGGWDGFFFFFFFFFVIYIFFKTKRVKENVGFSVLLAFAFFVFFLFDVDVSILNWRAKTSWFLPMPY
jgi:hypothetical protein